MRLPFGSWTNTHRSMGFRKRKHANERPAKRLAFENLEDRRVRTGLSPVLTTDVTPQAIWSEQLATGSPLLSGPVTDFAPSSTHPVDDGSLANLEQTAAVPASVRPLGTSDADFLAAALSQADALDTATYSLTGGAKQTSWSQQMGPQSLDASASSIDLRQLPEPQTLVFIGVDGIDDSLSLDLDTLPKDANGRSVVKDIVYEGGAGGFDTLLIAGGSFKHEVYTATGKNSGVITYSNSDDPTSPELTIIFTGLEPVYDYASAGSISVNGTDDADHITAVDGTPYLGADTIYVSEANGNFENVTFNNKGELGIFGLGGDDTIDVSGVALTNTAFPPNGFALYGGDGDDVLISSPSGTVSQVLSGGYGNDKLYSLAAAGATTFLTYLDGGPGDDQLYSGPANDILNGNVGSDTYYFASNAFLGSDEITEVNTEISAPDTDTIDVSANTDLTWVTLSYTDWQSITPSTLALKLVDANGIENFIGGSGGGSIQGNSRDNVLTAGGGTYGIAGNDGNDTIIGGAGNDYLVGGAGDDTIDGGAGNNGIYGEDGNDFLTGGDDGNYMIGGAGNDYMQGGAGADYLEGDAGDDQLFGGAGDDTLVGGDGNDTYVFDPSAAIDMNLGSDTIYEDANKDADTLDFSRFFDDQIVTIDLSNTSQQIVTPSVITLTLANYSTGIEDVLGGDAGDHIIGNNRDNYLNGYAGDDTLNGGDGNDTLVGDAGDDTLSGGAGDDSMFGDGGDDTADGGAGNDYYDKAPVNNPPNVYIASETLGPTVTDAGAYYVEILDGQTAHLQLNFAKEDPDGNNTFYTVLEQPEGSSFANGVFTWDVTNSVATGTYRIHLQVTDDGELSASDDKTWYFVVTHATSDPLHQDDFHPIATDGSYILPPDQTKLELTAHGFQQFLYSHAIDPTWTSTVNPAQDDNDPTRSQMQVVVDDARSEHGHVEYNPATDKITFTRETNYYGEGGFWYAVIDNNNGASNWAFVDVEMPDFPDIHIFYGQNGREVGSVHGDATGDDEVTKGAFTVANKNDTNADGLIDNGADETDVRPRQRVTAAITGSNPNWSTLTVAAADANTFRPNQPVVIATADRNLRESRVITTIADIQNDPNHKLINLNIPLSEDPLANAPANIVSAPGATEVDLMKVVIDKPAGDIVGELTLKVTTGNAKIWEHPFKGKEVLPLQDGYIHWTAEEVKAQFPKTLWVEATETSQNVRDITLRVDYAGQHDVAKATGIWATVTAQSADTAYNAVYASAPWSNEPEDVPPRRDVKLLGGVGKLPDHTDRHDTADANGKPTPHPGLWNAILIQFQVLPVLPAGEKWSQYGVAVDATQRLEQIVKFRNVSVDTSWVRLSPSIKSMPDQPDTPNDDGSDESRTVLDQGYYYHFDAPGDGEKIDGVNIEVGWQQINMIDFQSYLRVNLGPQPKEPGNQLWGSRASIFYDWHTFVHETGQNGVWVRKVPGSSDIGSSQVPLIAPP